MLNTVQLPPDNGNKAILSRRTPWIDIVKGIGIFFVTFGHLNPNIFIETHIYSFHMFLFFAVSGFLEKKEPEAFPVFFKKRFVRLIIPFIFWNTLSVLSGIILDNYSLKECINYLFVLNGELCWNSPLWFFLVLFETEIVMYFIRRMNMKIKIVAYIIILVLVYCFQNLTLPFKMSLVPVASLFYLVGKLFHWLYEKYLVNMSGINKAIHTFMLLAVNILFSVILNTRISVINARYGNIFFCFIAGIAGTFAYFFIAQLIKHNRLLEFLGRNTMFFICTQYFFFRAGQIISSKYFDYDLWRARSTAKALIFSVAVMAVSSLIILILKKLPFVRLKQIIGV